MSSNSEILRKVISIASGDVLLLILRLVGILAIATKVDIAVLGQFTTLMAWSSLLVVLAIFGGYNLVVQHVKTSNKGEAYFSASLILLFIFGAFLSVVISKLFFNSIFLYAMIILFFEVLSLGIKTLLKAYFFSSKQYSKITYINIGATLAYAVSLSIYMFFLKGMDGLVLFVIVYNFLSLSVFVILILKTGYKFRIKMGGEILIQGGYFTDAKYYVVSSFSRSLFTQADKILINFIAGNEVSGIYNLASRCASATGMPLSVMAQIKEPDFYNAKLDRYSLMRKEGFRSVFAAIILYFLSIPVSFLISRYSIDLKPMFDLYLYFSIFVFSSGMLMMSLAYLNGIGDARFRFVLMSLASIFLIALCYPIYNLSGITGVPVFIGVLNFTLCFIIFERYKSNAIK